MSDSTLRLLRLRDILGDPRAKPPVPPMIPVCKATWYAGMEIGRYPKPVRLGANIVAWRLEDIRRLIEGGTTA